MNTSFYTLILTAFATGLAGSAHCLSMCGGISATLGLNSRHKQFIITYHIGRLLSYVMLGLFLGAILPLFGLHASQPTWGKMLRTLTACLIILIGIQIFFDIKVIRHLERYGFVLWRPISSWIQGLLPTRTHSDAFILGLLWGLLPCGLIYTTLGLAITSANPFTAAVVMFLFGLGTLPSMLSVSIFSGTIIKALTLQSSKKLLGIIVIALGLWSLLIII